MSFPDNFYLFRFWDSSFPHVVRFQSWIDEIDSANLSLPTVENGEMLAAISLTTYEMPLVVELGIFFDLLVVHLRMTYPQDNEYGMLYEPWHWSLL